MAKKRTKRTPKKAKPRRRSAPDWAPAFLARVAQAANIRSACLAAGVGRSTVYQRRDADPDFAAALALALDDAVDDLELEARRRALEGVVREKGVFHKGEQVATETITEYSDTLMIFLLKAHRPAKYRDHYQVEHTGGLHVEISELVCRTREEAAAALSAVAEAG